MTFLLVSKNGSELVVSELSCVVYGLILMMKSPMDRTSDGGNMKLIQTWLLPATIYCNPTSALPPEQLLAKERRAERLNS